MKNIYKYIFLTAYLICFIHIIYAQPTDAKRDKIDELRAAFIAKKVNFTKQESLLFWPLYNEMNDKLEAGRKAFRAQYNASTNYNFDTDKEAEAYLNAELALRQREFELYKEYYDKFKKIMPVKKVVALRRAEEDFKKELIKSIKDN
ncbi:MAG: hypothetical protein ACXVPU_16500 [Bacteroidia bacterium]